MIKSKKPRKKRETNYYPKDLPIGIAWATAAKPDGKVKVKVVKNRNIDEIMAMNYILPGIPEDAVIKAVVMGKSLCEGLKERYNCK